MSAVFLDDGIVHYEVLGRGRPVIFLHSWIGSWRYWIPAMQSAAVSFRCYALDLWGFGDTSRRPNNYPIDRQAVLIDNFLIRMGLVIKNENSGERFGKIAIISHGLGALVAMVFTRRFPTLVDRLMIINVPLDINDISSRLRSPGPVIDLSDWLLGRDLLANDVRVEASKVDPQAINQSMNNLASMDFFSAIQQLQVPCLLVHGLTDPAVSAGPEERFFQKPPCFHQIFLEQSGHFPMLDDSIRFNRLMADFLSLPSGADPSDLQLKEEWRRRMR